MRRHTVGNSECISVIAAQYGMHWQYLWNLPENSALKMLRKNPNILFAGDVVMVPDLTVQEYAGATDQRHKFRLYGFLSKVRMRLLDDGEPRSSLAYSCQVENRVIKGKTDSNGELAFSVPPGATTGLLRVIDGDHIEEYALTFGELDPIEEVSGVQQRLRNLGYPCEDTREMDEQTASAISQFRAARQMPEGDDADEQVRAELLKVHGS